jgi:predicted ATPase
MESTLNIYVAELEELAKSIRELYNQKYYEAASLYCRMFMSKFLLAIAKEENFDIENAENMAIEELVESSSLDNINFPLKEWRMLRFLFEDFDEKAPSNMGKYELSYFNALMEWFRDYVSNKQNKDKVNRNGVSKLTQTIQGIEIKRYQCIDELVIKNLPVDNQFIVFTGENGYGKTSILQAIAIGLCGGIDEQNNEILLNGKESAVAVTIYENDNLINQVVTNKNMNPTAIIQNIIAYGASRLQIEAPESMYEYDKKRSPIYSLFHTEGVLQNIEYWLLNEASSNQRELVRVLLLRLLPHIDNIVINRELKSVTYIEKKRSVKAVKLSAGHKNILGMVGDMLIRLYRQQPDVVSPNNLTGIVLIDEIEAHLHPIWQREFPKLLAEIFPKIQFVVTTHSVITFLGMPKNSVFFNVSRSENGETDVKQVDIDIANFLPHQILTSPIFGMDNVLSVENTDFGKIRTENSYEEVIERDKIRSELKGLSQNFTFPTHLINQ